MVLEIPMGDVNLEGGNYDSPLPGRYIAEVNAWGESEDKASLYYADLEIQASRARHNVCSSIWAARTQRPWA